MSESKTSQATSPIETIRAACHKHTTEQLKKIATVSTNQIKVMSEMNKVTQSLSTSQAMVADLRSVRAAAIDVIVERLGEFAGDRFMDELGL
jgi:hypothetical protein